MTDSMKVPVSSVASEAARGVSRVSPDQVPPGASVATETQRYREALERIGPICTNHVKPYTCRDEGSGKTRDAQYTGDRWCDACIAADALRIPMRWRRGQTGYIRVRVSQSEGVSPTSFIIVTVPSGKSGTQLFIDASEVLTAAQVAESTR